MSRMEEEFEVKGEDRGEGMWCVSREISQRDGDKREEECLWC